MYEIWHVLNLANAQNAIFGEDLIWRMANFIKFGEDLIWRMDKNAKFGGNLIWQMTQKN